MAISPALHGASVARAVWMQEDHPSPRVLGRALALFVRWRRVTKLRQQLAQLDDRLLRDIGFDPVQVRQEAAKPFWSACTLALVV
jgi:uncharacterized protein YjiS (DUF1127 family)